jgi:hypothetical protein
MDDVLMCGWMNESMNEGMDGKKNGLLGSWRDDLIK